jgi:uncharacterized protein YndB with AHSA1/START domain
MSDTKITKDAANKSLIMERVFSAPRERVWQAWTDPQVFEKWWGPRGWTTKVKEPNFQVGGSTLYGMTCVDESQGEWFGQSSWGKMEFLAINEPDSFVYKDFFSDENGVVSDEMPVMTITMEFIEEDGKTRVISTGVFDDEEGYNKVLAMGVEQGAAETWDRLAELVSQAA